MQLAHTLKTDVSKNASNSAVKSKSILTSWYCKAINGKANPGFLLKKKMSGKKTCLESAAAVATVEVILPQLVLAASTSTIRSTISTIFGSAYRFFDHR